MESLFVLFLIFIGLLLIVAPFTLLIGLYKIVFQKEQKKFGIQLLTFSIIVIIIGYGACISLNKTGF